MFRLSRHARAFALGALMTLVSFSYASAHCFVGARFFSGDAGDRRPLRRG